GGRLERHVGGPERAIVADQAVRLATLDRPVLHLVELDPLDPGRAGESQRLNDEVRLLLERAPSPRARDLRVRVVGRDDVRVVPAKATVAFGLAALMDL